MFPVFSFRLSPVKVIGTCLLLLNVISLVAVYSSLHQAGAFTEHPIFTKQVIWIIGCWFVLIIFSYIDYRFYLNIAFILYGVSVILLLAVDLFGKKVMGAQRWLSISGFSFQPSEIAKMVMILVLARLFSGQGKRGFMRSFAIPGMLTAASSMLIFKQPDLGTALILIFLFFIIGLVSGSRKRYFIICIVCALALAPFASGVLKGYQMKRLIVFMNPNVDPLGAGYTIIQSKIAIGSGRLLGKGFLSGTQNQFNFLPERHTDFIFTVIAEEWGFLGSVFLLMVYWTILSSMVSVARDLKDPAARLLILGISALLFLHIFINIGMTLGILPVVGVPLLFVSYGGTHLLTMFILLGIFFNIYRQEIHA
ncbi:MAG: rod shape-determining protein RodA [Candidatus Omnitrophota bacterium]|nr:rod shape-determining protein RodA [Candidatus Omnitrophota bacterium]